MLIVQPYLQHFRRILYLGNIDCEISREILRLVKCWLTIAGYGCWHINDYLYIYACKAFCSELLRKHALYSHLKSKHLKDFKSENSGRKRIFKISILKLLWKFRKKFKFLVSQQILDDLYRGKCWLEKAFWSFKYCNFRKLSGKS